MFCSAGDFKIPTPQPHACATAVRQEIAMSFEGQDVVVEVASTQSCNNERRFGFNKLEENGGKHHFLENFGKPRSCPPVKRNVCWFCYVLLTSGGSK